MPRIGERGVAAILENGRHDRQGAVALWPNIQICS